jgi:DNA-binding CsgD family transcriptional regulator
MRRLILEVLDKELSKVGIELPQFRPIKSLQLLYFLRQDPTEFAAISLVEFKDPQASVSDLLKGGLVFEAQVLEKQKNGAYIVFMRGGPGLSSLLSSIGVEGGYLFTPIGIGDGKIRISFLGSEQQVKDFMMKVDNIGIRYRVLLLADASFSLLSPLNLLTEKQREVLLTAYRMGYYDIPRKSTTGEIAKKLGIVDSTVVEHLRKAERRLIKQIIEQ